MNTHKALPLIILLSGPTGVGKTALSLKIATRLGTEIVNADSMQVYRYMDIGTAKPSAQERALVQHHLLDVADPDEAFDAARYSELAWPIVDRLYEKGQVPLVVGGTGLYMKVLTLGICQGAPSDTEIRRQLMEEEERQGLHALYEDLRLADPELASRVHPNDRQRILRALEVYRLTGKPITFWQAKHRFQQSLYRTIKIFLHREREELYDRINRRVHIMIEQGFVEEVRRLMERGYGPELKSMQSLGYRQMVQFLSDETSLEAAVSAIQKETRRYAKRQMTWFRADRDFRWFDARAEEHILNWVEERIRAVESD